MRKKAFGAIALLLLVIPLLGCGNEERAEYMFRLRNSPIIYNGKIYFFSEDQTISPEEISDNKVIIKSKSILSEKKECYYSDRDNGKEILVSNENDLLCNYMSSDLIEGVARTEALIEKYDDFVIEKLDIKEKGGFLFV